MKLGLGSTLLNTGGTAQAGVSPTLSAYLDQAPYTTDAGFANQASVGSANFNLRTYVGPSLTYTRATAATFRGSNGLIQYAPENLLFNSQNPAASWTPILLNTTGTPTWSNVATAPDGTQTAAKLIPNGTFDYHFINISQVSYVSGQTYTFSFYAKAAEYSTVHVVDNVFTGARPVVFNLLTGQYTRTHGISADMVNVGNGWFRCSYTSIATATSTSFGFWRIGVGGTTQFQGNNSDGVLIWGAQLERASAARPYISTTSDPRYGPRFEYDTNGEPLGLLMEEQSQNLVYPSATLTTQTRTVTAEAHTLSFYGTGSVVLSGTHSATVTGTGASTRTVYTFTPTAGSLTLTVSGSVTSAQLEAKPFATSYIPTVGGSDIRNADVLTCAISSWFNLTEGTIVVSGDRNNNPTINAAAFDSFYEFTGSGGYTVVHASDGITEAIFDAAGNYATASGSTIGSLTGVAASYSSTTNLLHISRDGLAAQSGPVGGLGVMPVTLNIGNAPISTIGNWNGHVKSFRYYPKAYPTKLQQYSQV